MKTKTMRILSLSAAAVAALLLGIYLAPLNLPLPGKNAETGIDGFMWPRQKDLKPFAMLDHTAAPFTLAELQDHWNIMFFGYTYCPDICPITLSVMRETNQLLKENTPDYQDDTRFVFVSVDGERDTPAQMKEYIRYYDPSFIALTGSRAEVDSLTTQLGVPYHIEAHAPGDDYLVAHSGALFLISPAGKLAAVFQMPHDPKDLIQSYQDIRRFMAEQS